MPFDFLHFVVTLVLCSMVFSVMRMVAVGVLQPVFGSYRARWIVHVVGGAAFTLLCLMSILVYQNRAESPVTSGPGWIAQTRSDGAFDYHLGMLPRRRCCHNVVV